MRNFKTASLMKKIKHQVANKERCFCPINSKVVKTLSQHVMTQTKYFNDWELVQRG